MELEGNMKDIHSQYQHALPFNFPKKRSLPFCSEKQSVTKKSKQKLGLDHEIHNQNQKSRNINFETFPQVVPQLEMEL